MTDKHPRKKQQRTQTSPAETVAQLSAANPEAAAQVDAIRAESESGIPVSPERPPVRWSLGILNDDLANYANGTYRDGGPLSSQVSITRAQKIGAGKLAGSDLIMGISETTSTAWGYQFDQVFSAGYAEALRQESQGIKAEWDAGQMPTAEQYRATGILRKELPERESGRRTHISVRGDVGYVSGKPYVQNTWHGALNAADYFRSQKNTVQNQVTLNVETVGSHTFEARSARMDKALKIMGGAAVGGGGAGKLQASTMLGIEAGISSEGAAPQRVYSAVHANTAPEALTDAHKKDGWQWAVQGHAQLFLSAPNDPRTTLSQKATAPRHVTAEYGLEQLMEIRGTPKLHQQGNDDPIPGTYGVSHPATEQFVIAAPVTAYRFRALNGQAGIRMQAQKGNFSAAVDVGVVTNPSKPMVNPAFQEGVDEVKAFYQKQHYDTYWQKAGVKPWLNDPIDELSAMDLAGMVVKEDLPSTSPRANFYSQVTLSYTIPHQKKAQHHQR